MLVAFGPWFGRSLAVLQHYVLPVLWMACHRPSVGVSLPQQRRARANAPTVYYWLLGSETRRVLVQVVPGSESAMHYFLVGASKLCSHAEKQTAVSCCTVFFSVHSNYVFEETILGP